MEEQVRQDVMQELITRATNDPNFLNNVRNYPVSTLSQYGITLRDVEMDEVFGYLFAQKGVSNEDVISDLRELSEEPGPSGPRPKRW